MARATKSCLLVVDDHEIVRMGMRALLSKEPQYELLEASSAEEAVNLYDKRQPDIIIMDLMMPGMGGLKGVQHLRAKNSRLPILIISMLDDPIHVGHAIRAGAHGYVTKARAASELSKALKALSEGQPYFSNDLAFVGNNEYSDDARNLIRELSKREFEIFQRLVKGVGIKEIATDLHCSPKTVSNHRLNVLRKLEVNSVAELTRVAIRAGLLVP